MSYFGRMLAALAIVMGGSMTAAHAQQVKLKIAHPYADGHYLSKHGIKIWADEVTRLTNGAVTFEYFPSNQLGKAQVSLLQTGLADISMLVPSQEVALMPLSSVLELPGFVDETCSAAATFNKLGRPGGILDKMEFGPLGVRLLYTNMLPPYAIMTKTRPVRTMKDMEGLKLRANGAAIGETMRLLGAVPLTLGSAEVYESLSRGTIDGLFFPWAGITPYSLEKELKYITTGVALGGAYSLVTISEESWKKLPANARDAMLKAADKAQDNLCKWLEEDEGKTREAMATKHGIAMTVIGKEEAARWYARIDSVVGNWVKKMRALGKDGQVVIDAAKASKGN